ncbi:unnamed protein product, partial [Mesorhabditis spiculigera]
MLHATAQCFLLPALAALEVHKRWKWSRKTMIWLAIFHYVSINTVIQCVIYSLPIECTPDSLMIKSIIGKFPNFSFLTQIPDVCVTGAAPMWPPYIQFSGIFTGLTLAACMICYVATVCLYGIWHTLSLLRHSNNSMSEKTRMMHKQYFKVLYIGMSIPAASLGVPYVALEYILNFGVIFPQGVNNLLVGFHAAHSTLASIAIFLLTPSYRNYVFGVSSAQRHYTTAPSITRVRPDSEAVFRAEINEN